MPPDQQDTLTRWLTQPLLDCIDQAADNHAGWPTVDDHNQRQQFDLETLRQDYQRVTSRLQQQVHDLSQAKPRCAKPTRWLEQRVAQRTAELEQLNRELEFFLFGVARSARPAARHCRLCPEPEEDLGPKLDPLELQMLQRILANGFRMNQLIDDLLACRAPRSKPCRAPHLICRHGGDIADRLLANAANR